MGDFISGIGWGFGVVVHGMRSFWLVYPLLGTLGGKRKISKNSMDE